MINSPDLLLKSSVFLNQVAKIEGETLSSISPKTDFQSKPVSNFVLLTLSSLRFIS